MSKKAIYQAELARQLEEYLAGRDASGLTDYLASHSNLPGPRGNLELAEAFSDMLTEMAGESVGSLWELCVKMSAISADEAPTNDPREFIPFCGTVGIGALGAAVPTLYDDALKALRRLAEDPRWRMREAIAMGLQRLLRSRPDETLTALEGWISGGSPLTLRATAAAVAEPALLVYEETAQRALRLHRRILERVAGLEDRRSDEFKTLRQALGYTLSVVVQALPEPGFAFLRGLAATPDADVRWIVRENLKKNRLVRYFPADVARVKDVLEKGH
jgi:hypothetical protein